MISQRHRALFPTALALIAWVHESAVEPPKWTSRDEILYSDLVVCGIVGGLDTEWVSINEYAPGISDDNRKNFRISNLTLNVLEVLVGDSPGETLRAVVPGGFPGDPPDVLAYNYTLGDTVIICLVYRPSMKSGSYVVRDDKGRFRLSGGTAVCQHREGQNLTIGAIRAIAREARIETLVSKADLVGVGTVTDIRKPVEYTVEGYCKSIEYVTVRVSRFLKGNTGRDTLTFRMIRTGFYDPPWREWVPEIESGQEWVFFLRQDEDGYYPFAGGNGLLRVQGDTLIWRNRVEFWMTSRELERVIRDARAGGD